MAWVESLLYSFDEAFGLVTRISLRAGKQTSSCSPEVAASVSTSVCNDVVNVRASGSQYKADASASSSDGDVNLTSCLLTLALEAPDQCYQRQLGRQAGRPIRKSMKPQKVSRVHVKLIPRLSWKAEGKTPPFSKIHSSKFAFIKGFK